MSALMLCVEALVNPGDRVVCVTPLWPNLTEIPKILGAEVVRVTLEFGASGWNLDLRRLLDGLTPGTRAVMINSPNNPTGWTLDRDDAATILAHCRKHGIWIIADDVYERLYYAEGAASAPSFLDLMASSDRVVSTNSFSKAWLMTGWRLGWIVAPPALMPDLGKLIEYNTSCAPVFVQRAGVTAITEGEPTVQHTLARFRAARDFLVGQLTALDGIEVASPPGAMYVFFRVAGVTDSFEFCKRLVREARLGLAPGSAFGPEGQGFVRWCFAASEERLLDGVGTFTVKVRPGIYFADDPAFKGRKRELVAEDYVYSIKRIFDPKLRSYWLYLFDRRLIGLDAALERARKADRLDYDAKIEGLQAIDRYTLRIRFNTPYYSFQHWLSYDGLAAVAREVVEAHKDASNRVMEHPVGTGPYRLKDWVRGQKIVLEANPGYRDETYPVPGAGSEPGDAGIARDNAGKKLPIVGRVEISVIEEDSPRLLSFDSGALDFLELRRSLPANVLAKDALLPAYAKRGVVLHRQIEPSISLTFFNLDHPVVR